MSNQTLTEGVLNTNPVLINIKSENLLDPYLRELMLEQGKHVPLSQDKLLPNLQQRSAYVYGTLNRIWTAIETEKESLEGSEKNLGMPTL